jgi:hypothetical protein
MKKNFQDMNLRAYKNTFIILRPCSPGLWSGTLNILQVCTTLLGPPFLTYCYKDINMKLSGYLL